MVRYNPKTLLALGLNVDNPPLVPMSKQVKGTGPTNGSVTWKAFGKWKMNLYGTRICKARHACIAHWNNQKFGFRFI